MPVTYCTIQKSGQAATTQERLAAANKLSGATFKLYTYFDSFENPTILYDRLTATKILNIHRVTINTSFTELCDLGYLVPCAPDVYNFFTTPVEKI